MITRLITKGLFLLVMFIPMSCELFDRPEKKPEAPGKEGDDTAAVIPISNDTIYYDVSYLQSSNNTYICTIAFSSESDLDKVYVNISGTLTYRFNSSLKSNFDARISLS